MQNYSRRDSFLFTRYADALYEMPNFIFLEKNKHTIAVFDGALALLFEVYNQ